MTPKHRLAVELLRHHPSDPVELDELVAERRAAGASLRELAAEISERTGVLVTYEGLRRWYPVADEADEVSA